MTYKSKQILISLFYTLWLRLVADEFSVNKNLSFLFDSLLRSHGRMYKKVKFIFIVIVKM